MKQFEQELNDLFTRHEELITRKNEMATEFIHVISIRF